MVIRKETAVESLRPGNQEIYVAIYTVTMAGYQEEYWSCENEKTSRRISREHLKTKREELAKENGAKFHKEWKGCHGRVV